MMHKEMGFSLDDIESMLPYERDIYIGLFNKDVEVQRNQIRDEEARFKGQFDKSSSMSGRGLR